MKKSKSMTPTVKAVGQMSFSGDMVPHNWYKTIVTAKGTPDSTAILVLARFVYWHRPQEVLDREGRRVLRLERKFDADKFRINANGIAKFFGLSVDGARDVLNRLVKQHKVLTRELRTVELADGMRLQNVSFWDIDVERLRWLTFHGTEHEEREEDSGIESGDDEPDPLGNFPGGTRKVSEGVLESFPSPLMLKPQTYTKNTTKSSSKSSSVKNKKPFAAQHSTANGNSTSNGIGDMPYAASFNMLDMLGDTHGREEEDTEE